MGSSYAAKSPGQSLCEVTIFPHKVITTPTLHKTTTPCDGQCIRICKYKAHKTVVARGYEIYGSKSYFAQMKQSSSLTIAILHSTSVTEKIGLDNSSVYEEKVT